MYEEVYLLFLSIVKIKCLQNTMYLYAAYPCKENMASNIY